MKRGSTIQALHTLFTTSQTPQPTLSICSCSLTVWVERLNIHSTKTSTAL